jgi:hypothetical protein
MKTVAKICPLVWRWCQMQGSPRAASLGLTKATNQVFDREWHTPAVSYHQVPVPLIQNQQHKNKNKLQ